MRAWSDLLTVRTGSSPVRLLTATLGLVLLTALVVLPAPPSGAARWVPKPVLDGNFADPAVERYRNGFVGIATGEHAPRALTRSPRGKWVRGGPALRTLPAWARAGDIWAADIQRVGGWWLLYFAAPVDGLGEYGRCVGVARSRSPRRGFAPVGDRPLSCPTYAKVPQAQDPLPLDPTLPRAGTIDPSVYVDPSGTRFLVYKTDRIPSSIRMVQLSDNGSRVATGAVSQELLRFPGVVENPVIVHRPQGWVMLLSEGDYTRCSYQTVWLRSPSLLDWSVVESGTLLSSATTGLCGPGGADVAVAPGGQQRLFLHGWTCFGKPRPCRSSLDWSKREKRRAVRSMYAARLVWNAGVPRVKGWLKP